MNAIKEKFWFIITFILLFIFFSSQMLLQATENLENNFGFNNTIFSLSGALAFGLILLQVLTYKRYYNNINVPFVTPLKFFLFIEAIWMIISMKSFSLYDIFRLTSSTIFPLATLYFGIIVSKIFKSKQLFMILLFGFFLMISTYSTIYSIVIQNTIIRPIMVASYIIILLPILFLIDNKYLKITLFLISVTIAISCMKRSIPIALAFGSLSYYFCVQYTNKKSIFKMVLGLIIIISFMSFFLLNYDFIDISVTLERFASLEDDGGSGRDVIFNKALGIFYNSDFLTQLFGQGYMAVIKRIGFSAHNDFIEILVDFGIIGLIFYLTFILKLIITIKKQISKKNVYASIMLFSLVEFFVLSMVSHIIIYPIFMLFTLTWGCCLGSSQITQKLVSVKAL